MENEEKKKIIKIRSKINAIENRKAIGKNNSETKYWFFEKESN